jgi:hypothetical protein
MASEQNARVAKARWVSRNFRRRRLIHSPKEYVDNDMMLSPVCSLIVAQKVDRLGRRFWFNEHILFFTESCRRIAVNPQTQMPDYVFYCPEFALMPELWIENAAYLAAEPIAETEAEPTLTWAYRLCAVIGVGWLGVCALLATLLMVFSR